MPKIVCLPDKREFDIGPEETVLDAALRAGIPHAHACGGHAKCSTCRIWILDGLEHCADSSEAERTLSSALGFGPEVRLACQTRVHGDVKLRRLVLDEADLEISSQLPKERHGRCGENKAIAVLFCDIRDFTAFSRTPEGGDRSIERFFVAGGSKRGWTTWTTAAVDKRVVAISPMVIDMLNVVPSFVHHWRVYGFWAPAIKDYVDSKVIDWMFTPENKKLLQIADGECPQRLGGFTLGPNSRQRSARDVHIQDGDVSGLVASIGDGMHVGGEFLCGSEQPNSLLRVKRPEIGACRQP